MISTGVVVKKTKDLVGGAGNKSEPSTVIFHLAETGSGPRVLDWPPLVQVDIEKLIRHNNQA